jgi:threonine dehydratase
MQAMGDVLKRVFNARVAEVLPESTPLSRAERTQDDLAKTHIRHIVGGLADEAQDEVLYRFEFPERPGALAQFLTSLSDRWSISVFHYRNHGAVFGRVLCGLEVPEPERADLEQRLDRLGFSYQPVGNSAATVFLSKSR